MGKILCSTRGGEASIRTQEEAIRRAKETSDELIFFYVTDVEFLAFANYALHSDLVVSEMDRMAEFLMTMAVERAEKAGVAATYLIRHGDFVEELRRTIEEEGITLVILGQPSEEEGAFRLAELRALAQRIHKETGVAVWIPGLDEDAEDKPPTEHEDQEPL